MLDSRAWRAYCYFEKLLREPINDLVNNNRCISVSWNNSTCCYPTEKYLKSYNKHYINSAWSVVGSFAQYFSELGLNTYILWFSTFSLNPRKYDNSHYLPINCLQNQFFQPIPFLALIRMLYRIKLIWIKFFLQLYNPTNKPTESWFCLKL